MPETFRRRDYWRIATEPLEEPPYFRGGRVEVIARVLAGLELGAWDHQTVRWLAEAPAPLCMAVCAWIERARESGRRLYPEEIDALDDATLALAQGAHPELAVQVMRVRHRLTEPPQSM
jgi:hypothetical protein